MQLSDKRADDIRPYGLVSSVLPSIYDKTRLSCDSRVLTPTNLLYDEELRCVKASSVILTNYFVNQPFTQVRFVNFV